MDGVLRQAEREQQSTNIPWGWGEPTPGSIPAVPIPSPRETGHRLLISLATGQALSPSNPEGRSLLSEGGSELAKAISRTGQLSMAALKSHLCFLVCFCSGLHMFGCVDEFAVAIPHI